MTRGGHKIVSRGKQSCLFASAFRESGYRFLLARELPSLANYDDMARVQAVGAQLAVPLLHSCCILRASTNV